MLTSSQCDSTGISYFIETAAALVMTELVDQGYLTVMQMAEKMSYNPAKILGLDKGVVEEGKPADLVVFDPKKQYVIDPFIKLPDCFCRSFQGFPIFLECRFENMLWYIVSYIGAVVGATYPEMGRILRKIMPKSFILVPGYGAQGGTGADLVHFFNEDGLLQTSTKGLIPSVPR